MLPLIVAGLSAGGLIGFGGLNLESTWEIQKEKRIERGEALQDRLYYERKTFLDRLYNEETATLDYQRDMFKIAMVNTDNAASRANASAMQMNAQAFDAEMFRAEQDQLLADRQLYLESQIMNASATDTMLGENDTPETLAYILTELVKMYRDDTQTEPINGTDTEPDYSGFYTNALGKNTYFKGDNLDD